MWMMSSYENIRLSQLSIKTRIETSLFIVVERLEQKLFESAIH